MVKKSIKSNKLLCIEYLAQIESQLAEIKIELRRLEEKKADKETLADFAKRIAKIEQDMEHCKILCKDK